MPNIDQPYDIEEQIKLMKKYVLFRKNIKIRRMLKYTGYFRLSCYGKYLLSYTTVLKTKPNQELLFDIYNLDSELRSVFFSYCKKAEIQFKSHLCNSVSLKLNDAQFYLESMNYTSSKGEKDGKKRKLNIRHYNKFINSITDNEKELRNNVKKYPDLKEYRKGGKRNKMKVPCWAAFTYMEFGTITTLYSYLNGALRKEVLQYGYSRKRYGKETTKQMDTWLDAIRNLRNVCAHHNKLVGRTSSIVLLDSLDDPSILVSNTDLFSRIYALKKVLNEQDSTLLKKDLQKVIAKSKIDPYKFNILPHNWESLYDRINYL
ncbi:MAG: Abi family protein [Cellulosilyticaceae bacterium]